MDHCADCGYTGAYSRTPPHHRLEGEKHNLTHNFSVIDYNVNLEW